MWMCGGAPPFQAAPQAAPHQLWHDQHHDVWICGCVKAAPHSLWHDQRHEGVHDVVRCEVIDGHGGRPDAGLEARRTPEGLVPKEGHNEGGLACGV